MVVPLWVMQVLLSWETFVPKNRVEVLPLSYIFGCRWGKVVVESGWSVSVYFFYFFVAFCAESMLLNGLWDT